MSEEITRIYEECWKRRFGKSDIRQHLPIFVLSIVENLFEQVHLRNHPDGYQYDRSISEFRGIESERFFLCAQALEEIGRRQANILKVRELLSSIWSGETSFALYLRNFDLSSVSGHTGGDGADEKITAQYIRRTAKIEQEISKAVEPIPLIKIHNLEDFDYGIPALEIGDDWQNAVQRLITKAAFIVFIYRSETPGVSVELDLLRELGREASTIVLLEKAPESAPRDFPTRFQIDPNADLPDEAATLIARYAGDAKPVRFDDPPPSPKRFWLNGDMRRGYIVQCDISLLQARIAFAGIFTAPGDLGKIYEAFDWAVFSFASAFMTEDELRMAQAACEMGYWLLYIPNIRMMGAATFYLKYAVAKLPRAHPQSLLAAQALCIACLETADVVGDPILTVEDAVALEAERFGASSGPREQYLHHYIQERLHARAGNGAEARAAHNLAVRAYRDLRQLGEPALFGDALVISMLSWGFFTGQLQKENLPNISANFAAKELVQLFIGTEAHDQLTAVLSGTAGWDTLFATLQSPAALVEAEALEAAVKSVEVR